VTAPMMEAEGLVLRYGAATVLDRVGLTVERGGIVGVIGPNGAGKSTLFRILAGLAEPDAGTVRFDGRLLSDWRRRDLARQIAYLPQNAATHWPLPVARLVALGRLPHLSAWQVPSRRDGAAVEAAMVAADVVALADRRVDTLSAGERARVLLARALAVEAPLLLADEPVAGLDPYHQLRVMELLQGTARQGAAVAVVLHDLTLAARFCDRVLVLRAGEVLADGAPRDAMTAEIMHEAYGISILSGARDGEPFLVPWRRSSSMAAVPGDEPRPTPPPRLRGA